FGRDVAVDGPCPVRVAVPYGRIAVTDGVGGESAQREIVAARERGTDYCIAGESFSGDTGQFTGPLCGCLRGGGHDRPPRIAGISIVRRVCRSVMGPLPHLPHPEPLPRGH